MDVIQKTRRPTKREILRIVMSIFDPLGFLGYFVVRAKILLQDIWRVKLGWDEPIEESLEGRWIRWLEDLTLIQNVKIPR